MRSQEHSIRSSGKAYLYLSLFLVVALSLYAILPRLNPHFNWAGISPDLKDLVYQIEKRGLILGPDENGSSARKAHDQQNQLMKLASTYELTCLKQYPNGAIRGLAYQGLLAAADYPNKSQLLKDALVDTLYSVEYVSDCLGFELSIQDFLLNIVFEEKYGNLSDQQQILVKYQIQPSDLDILRRPDY
ncbi:hypothetical protein [Croceimicrobium sp.]|uniref:hypothetical protein n=1 Tax=Croceimicrobium sp. TaxID=2828340 RepID=UPI003BA898FD